MGAHGDWDFGAPAPMVHFVERLHGLGFRRELIASVEMQSTAHTLWMLNRLTNGERAGAADAGVIVGRHDHHDRNECLPGHCRSSPTGLTRSMFQYEPLLT